MDDLLHNYLSRFDMADLDLAEQFVGMPMDDSLGLLTYGMRIAELSIKEQMTVFLFAYGYSIDEIATFRNVTRQAIYKTLSRIKGRFEDGSTQGE